MDGCLSFGVLVLVIVFDVLFDVDVCFFFLLFVCIVFLRTFYVSFTTFFGSFLFVFDFI